MKQIFHPKKKKFFFSCSNFLSFQIIIIDFFFFFHYILANDEEYCEECSSRGYCRDDGSCHCPFEYSWSKNCSQTRKELIDYDQFIVYRSWILAIYIVVEIYTIGTLIYLSPCCSGTVWTMNVQTGCYSCILIGYACNYSNQKKKKNKH